MKNKVKKRLFEDKRVVLIAAFLLAVLIWIIVGGFIVPNDEDSVDNIAINYTNLISNYRNRDLEVVTPMEELPTTVRATVSGDRSTIKELVNSDITVFPDYTGVYQAGVYELPLRYERVNGTNYEIMEVTPATVTIEFEKVVRTNYMLSVETDSVTAAPGYYKDEEILSTLQVEVSGPESEMDRVAGATVIITDTAQRESTYVYSNADVQLLDANGEVIEHSDRVTITPSVVNIEIPILVQKEISLAVGVSGTPPKFDTEWFEGLLTLSPDSITVAGEASLLENQSELQVGSIDISTFSMTNSTETFAVELPEGMKNLTGIQQAKVALNTSGLLQETFNIPMEDVQVINLPDGLSIAPVDADETGVELTVTLVGLESEITSLLPENITVELDASSIRLENGAQQTLAARVYVARSNRVFATGTYPLVCDVAEAAPEGG